MANYGDVALALKADWDRNKYEQQEWILSTVGHKDGKADLCLTREPDKRHQFYWADPKDQNDVTMAVLRGYEFVTKSAWTKNLILWSWNAEDHVFHAGLVAMARPAERFYADQQRRDKIASKSKSYQDDARVPEGIIATDADGNSQKRTNPRYGI